MTRTIRWLVVVLAAMGLTTCQRREMAPPASAGNTARISRASSTTEATSVPLSLSDLGTSATGLRVPQASLRALAAPRFRRLRLEMVDTQIAASHALDGRDPVRDPRVLETMRLVPRHEFVPPEFRSYSYADEPLPIGYDQTISQPYIVALMSELLKPKPDDRVLEVGTGSGYQAAVLSLLVKEVYSIEIVEPLAKRAEKDLRRLGYDNVHVLAGDGYRGWPDKAPFDSIIVTAAPERIPEPLVAQLKVGGRIVMPIGSRFSQELVVLTKAKPGSPRPGNVASDLVRELVIPVRFVPMVGEIQKEGKK